MCPMLAVRYKVYEAEAASTFLLTTLSMVIVVPIVITLNGVRCGTGRARGRVPLDPITAKAECR